MSWQTFSYSLLVEFQMNNLENISLGSIVYMIKAFPWKILWTRNHIHCVQCRVGVSLALIVFILYGINLSFLCCMHIIENG